MTSRTEFFSAPLNLRRSESAPDAETAQEMAESCGGFVDVAEHVGIEGAWTTYTVRWLVEPKPARPEIGVNPLALLIVCGEFGEDDIRAVTADMTPAELAKLARDVTHLRAA
jgi:hypothetical protein